ncbi:MULTISPECIES: transposase [unclassified Methylobacterium]|uniref:transposase n=1 Tax=unclassified Methylobacterium TaxID=2615210 RepID=UPI00226A3453|nr:MULTISPECIES: transposase [unclassified Methylobacterium]
MLDQDSLFWLSDAQWAIIAPYLPTNSQARSNDRHALSGIIHVSVSGCRWPDCPKVYGSPGGIYQRFSNWRHRPFWSAMLKALTEAGWVQEAQALDPVAMARARPQRRGLRIDRNWRPHSRDSDRQAGN